MLYTFNDATSTNIIVQYTSPDFIDISYLRDAEIDTQTASINKDNDTFYDITIRFCTKP